MGEFQFNTTNTWWVALQHGHAAFRTLKIVYDIEQEYKVNMALLPTLEYGRSEYLRMIGRNRFLTDDMFQLSATSIMMFQGMMEALINNALETEPRLSGVNKNGSFRSKWTDTLHIISEDTSNFEEYRSNIYARFRNPLVHPSGIQDDTFDNISFEELYYGFKYGWEAMAQLYRGLGIAPYDKNKWKEFCDSYGIPLIDKDEE